MMTATHPSNIKNRLARLALAAAVALLANGCATGTGHLSIQEPAKVEVLGPIKTVHADVPVKVQVVNFTITSVKSTAGNVKQAAIRRAFELEVPNRLYFSLGNRHAFSEVSRAVTPDLTAADFIVSGEYEFIYRAEVGWVAHQVYQKGTAHVRVMEAKTNVRIFEKSYAEEQKDESKTFAQDYPDVEYLQKAYIAEIAADIKRAIALKAANIP